MVVKAAVEISKEELDKIDLSVETIMKILTSETGIIHTNQGGRILMQGDWDSICKAKKILDEVRFLTIIPFVRQCSFPPVSGRFLTHLRSVQICEVN